MSEQPPRPCRFGLREAVFALALAVWVVAVLATERPAPLTPPVVSYTAAGR